ncbi:MAG TPA: prenyltransferase/squalene oxidase repeat-containing protein [Nitrososphaerales archaeon]|nr:prenyltransferase/squalene oxidase repeat-containing protein [Nitrososphaerales archaeon]
MEYPERLRSSLDRALRFLEGSVNPDGFWSDFLTLAGESVYWVTGYVGYALARGAVPRDEEEKRLLLGAGSRLLERQGEDGGWGYGPGVPADADSTSWCLLFLSRLGTQGAESRGKALRFLLKHQSPVDGGFRTYAEPREVGRFMMLDANVSFEGWSSSQMCVTPVAGKALLEAGSPVGDDKAIAYVMSGQAAEGYWEPYWWSERLYATVHCMEFLKARGAEEGAGPVRRAQDWIARTQLATGAWGDSQAAQGVPFSTALGIRGLMVEPRPEFADQIRRGADWLLTDQLTDGSWNSHHILRIPHPSTREPWKQPFWKQDGKAIDAVIKDHRRLYTTATAFTALSGLQERLSKGEE